MSQYIFLDTFIDSPFTVKKTPFNAKNSHGKILLINLSLKSDTSNPWYHL